MKKSFYKVCVLVPVLGIQNSILYVFSSLKKLGIEIIVITSTSGGYKSNKKNIPFEIIDNLQIYRVCEEIYSDSFMKEINNIRSILDSFKPSIILFGTWNLFKIASKLSRIYDTKLIWLTEFFFNDRRFVGGRKYYLGIKFLLKPIASMLRNYFYKNVDKIILSDISEKKYITKKTEKIIPIGWCNNLPNNFDSSPIKLKKKTDNAVFAGSLTKITINDKFIETVSFLLDNNLIEYITIIGDGPKRYIIEDLIYKYGNSKIKYLGQIDRLRVLSIIRKSKLALNTTIEGGWGFIGECFAVGTLLLFYRNHYLFNTEIDSLKIDFSQKGLNKLKEIINSDDKYERIQKNMKRRYDESHSSNSIAKKYKKVFDLVIINE